MPSAPAFARLYAFALAIDLGLEFVTSTTSTPATGVRVLVSKALFSGSSGFVEVTKASRPNKAPRPTKAPCPTPITGSANYEYLGGYDMDLYSLFCLLDWQTNSYCLDKSREAEL